MPFISYGEFGERKFQAKSLGIIHLANKIAADYESKGYNLTLRQLYYQFIARDAMPNTERSYKNLGSLINDARLAGLVDWEHIEDRGRTAYDADWLGHVPASVDTEISYLQHRHNRDLWEGQDRRIEVWVEKQALEQVAEKAARSFRVGYFACKGYVSQSEMWAAGQRQLEAISAGQTPLILHLGDHDPSGIDMTRDIEERLSLFAGEDVEVRRLALNMNQINDLNPPPNPAKLTDSRYGAYKSKYGSKSWELDAISPDRLVDIIKDEIRAELDPVLFNEQRDLQAEGREVYVNLSNNWTEAEALLREHNLI